MRRFALLVALLACSVPPAHGQAGDPGSPPRLSVTAFTGVRTPYGAEVVSVYLPSGGFAVQQERSGGALLGADLKLWLRGRVSLVGGGAFSPSGEARYFLSDTLYRQAPNWIATSSDPMWFAKLGVAARFESPRSITDTRLRPATDLVAGVAAVREFGATHPAANFGFHGSLPIGPGIAFSLGVENYLVFWDKGRISPTVAGIIQNFQEEPVDQVVLRYDTSNILQLRLGLTLHP